MHPLKSQPVLPPAATFVIAIALSVAVQADDAQPKPCPKADKSTLLFDGESLKNWKKTDFGTDSEVSVEDGNLVFQAGKPLTGLTWDGGDLPRVDYEISLEAQRVEGSDFFCGLTFPVQDDPCTLILGGWGGSLTGLSSINYLDASENETTDFFEFENGKWYKIRIRVTDSRIQAWLDDAQLADVDYTDQKIGIRFEMEPCRPLGYATYRTKAAVRNFKLRPLTDDEKQETDDEE
ncbi:MAG: DUF1080 domain-containing protein [Planctomycetota bacterium]|nr:MAG: DUF1080 domain-containing protein [Planctomycetota bacterium]REJ86868.1 MAG: DUF1080 domain-containing protein [Planctomycetota bacterium]REK22808.1 MAG: DUF1080 domain-containing protein [Planctomycetota bacterium]REK33772.1 MAG: DUF1080 domain-containing protein [Planctomycetota bacterium]